ncbi:MAG: hypothetical protein K6F08_00425 [bacterium]|nr:hypothetical protein [bacterium]
MENINVVVKDDDSVDKLLSKTAKTLQKKYSKQRKINEKYLKTKTPLQKTVSFFANLVCVILTIFAGLVCFSGINSKIQKVCPTFAGYTNMVVVSGSMIASGFKVGDSLVVKSVDTHTLHVDDKIAFYVYDQDYMGFDVNTCVKVKEEDIPQTVYTTSFSSLLGIQSDAIKVAAKNNAKLVFHHIRAIYEDDNGVRWFKTYGSSNMSDDVWYVSENMVVGKYVDGGIATIFSKLIKATNSKFGFLILLVPVLLLAALIVIEAMKDVQLAKLELDCVEEKRKITDPICVKNNIGFNMDSKTKYKVLVQAEPEEINQYISLLWKDNTVPANIRKYYTRKNILLTYNRKMLLLNRECQEMFKNGEKPNKVSKYYLEKKADLQEEQIEKEKALRAYIKANN